MEREIDMRWVKPVARKKMLEVLSLCALESANTRNLLKITLLEIYLEGKKDGTDELKKLLGV